MDLVTLWTELSRIVEHMTDERLPDARDHVDSALLIVWCTMDDGQRERASAIRDAEEFYVAR